MHQDDRRMRAGGTGQVKFRDRAAPRRSDILRPDPERLGDRRHDPEQEKQRARIRTTATSE